MLLETSDILKCCAWQIIDHVLASLLPHLLPLGGHFVSFQQVRHACRICGPSQQHILKAKEFNSQAIGWQIDCETSVLKSHLAVPLIWFLKPNLKNNQYNIIQCTQGFPRNSPIFCLQNSVTNQPGVPKDLHGLGPCMSSCTCCHDRIAGDGSNGILVSPSMMLVVVVIYIDLTIDLQSLI